MPPGKLQVPFFTGQDCCKALPHHIPLLTENSHLCYTFHDSLFLPNLIGVVHDTNG